MIHFVTGTDTDAGKTLISAGLLHAARKQGLLTLGLKPIAAGCAATPDGLRNDDALALMAQSSLKVTYEQVNPIALEPAIAPHIAANESDVELTTRVLRNALPRSAMADAQCCLVEGAGGWNLPLHNGELLPQWVAEEGWPVILVVGMKLGCLNHALLTVQAIEARGLKLAGWIANGIDPGMSRYQDNLATLQAAISAPLLAKVPHLGSGATAGQAAKYLQDAVRVLWGN